MNWELIIGSYGYIALLLGTFLEGETILILAGFAAHLGYLYLPWVILVAFLGTLSGDQLSFYLGRRQSRFFLDKHPAWQRRLERVERLFERYQTLLILGFRFLYGLRTVTPFVLGRSGVAPGYFFLLSTVGAMVWSLVVGTGGYLFGNLLKIIVGDIKRYELEAFGAIAIIGGLIWGVCFYHSRRKKFPEKIGSIEKP
jgi:membrane protein DedA with SNARE-associated domain